MNSSTESFNLLQLIANDSYRVMFHALYNIFVILLDVVVIDGSFLVRSEGIRRPRAS
jgi:hypothetical protein